MTEQEFKNLKFGDKIYDTSGTCYLWTGNTEELMVGTLLYHIYGDMIGILKYLEINILDNFFLTKPKKKVKKEITMYTNHLGEMTMLDGGVAEIWGDADSSESDIKLTITYETEE